MSELLLAFLLSGPVAEPTAWEFAALDICPLWLRYELYDAAARKGLVWDVSVGGEEWYWDRAGCFPEWLVLVRARAGGTPLREDQTFGEYEVWRRWLRAGDPRP